MWQWVTLPPALWLSRWDLFARRYRMAQMNDRALLPAHVPVPQELGNWKGAERHLVYLSQNREHRCLCDEMGWGRKERQTDREEKYNLKLCELPWEMLYVLFLEFSFCFLIFHRHPWEVLLYYPSTSHPWIPASLHHSRISASLPPWAASALVSWLWGLV